MDHRPADAEQPSGIEPASGSATASGGEGSSGIESGSGIAPALGVETSSGIESGTEFEPAPGVEPSSGIEQLRFAFDGRRAVPAFAPVLVGVVGSGNLEVLLEPAADDRCTVEVATSARGFEPIWAAVMGDFHARHPLAGVRISINDMGATPAVVGLRLRQAVAALGGGAA